MKATELQINSTYMSVKWQKPVRLELSDLAELDHLCQGAELDSEIIGYMFEPIELTEEWLIKTGFEKVNHIGGYSFWSLKRHKKMSTPNICIYDSYTRIGNNSSTNHLKYVHQLQNLYFALTEKELTIK